MFAIANDLDFVYQIVHRVDQKAYDIYESGRIEHRQIVTAQLG